MTKVSLDDVRKGHHMRRLIDRYPWLVLGVIIGLASGCIIGIVMSIVQRYF